MIVSIMGKKITIEQLECTRCGYKWFPRVSPDGKIVKPKTCANIKCKSPYYDKKKTRFLD